jgi:hypothetical protein
MKPGSHSLSVVPICCSTVKYSEDVATMPTSHHDYLPNGVRDDPGIYTL